MERGTATWAVVPREWDVDDQNATSPEHSNQRKKRSISKPVIFFYKIVATEKQLLTSVLRFNNCQATKSGSTSRLESVISSLLVILMRIFLKETTCIVPPGSWESSYSQPGGGRGRDGGGEVKWTLKKG